MPDNNAKKEKEWKQRLTDWQQSGLSAIKWCKEHDISYHTFKYWRSKLGLSKRRQGGFIEISSNIDLTQNSGITINVGLFQVQLERNFDETALEHLLVILRRSA